MRKMTLNVEKASTFVCSLLGMAFLLSIVAALAWGSYVTYYGLVTKGVRGIEATVKTQVIARLDAMTEAESNLERYLLRTAVSECVHRSFDGTRVHKTLRSIAGWHAWREFSEAEMDIQVQTLLDSCITEFQQADLASQKQIASIK